MIYVSKLKFHIVFKFDEYHKIINFINKTYQSYQCLKISEGFKFFGKIPSIFEKKFFKQWKAWELINTDNKIMSTGIKPGKITAACEAGVNSKPLKTNKAYAKPPIKLSTINLG